jgi:hypothetical protein
MAAGDGRAGGRVPIETHARTTARSRARRALLAAGLNLLPLLGLGGCSALWATVPVGPFLREASAPAFWAFIIATYVLAGLALCWGLGYLYANVRERLGCGLLVVGPLLVAIGLGYIFEGLRPARTDADEIRRGQAMLTMLLLAAGPALLMAWDVWRLARRPAADP